MSNPSPSRMWPPPSTSLPATSPRRSGNARPYCGGVDLRATDGRGEEAAGRDRRERGEHRRPNRVRRPHVLRPRLPNLPQGVPCRMASRQPVCKDFSCQGNPPSALASSRYHEWSCGYDCGPSEEKSGRSDQARPSGKYFSLMSPELYSLGAARFLSAQGREDTASRAWGSYGLVPGICGKLASSIFGPVAVSMRCQSVAVARSSSGLPTATKAPLLRPRRPGDHRRSILLAPSGEPFQNVMESPLGQAGCGLQQANPPGPTF